MGSKSSARAGRWTKRDIFIFKELQETAGAHAGFETSKADTDTPAAYFSTIVDPDTCKSGMITQIRIKLNWTNAVVLQAFRLWEAAIAGDYESNSRKIFDSEEYVVALNDDEEYVFDVNIPFKLDAAGVMYYAPQGSAACGNIAGHVTVKGEVYQ